MANLLTRIMIPKDNVEVWGDNDYEVMLELDFLYEPSPMAIFRQGEDYKEYILGNYKDTVNTNGVLRRIYFKSYERM